MTPGTYPLKIYRGDTYRYKFVLWSDTDHTEPVDLSEATVKAELRDKPGGTIYGEMQCTIELPNIIHGVLSADLTKSIPTKGGTWDMQLSFGVPVTDVKTVLVGNVIITADVTDSTGP
jgi:hypothetical protein